MVFKFIAILLSIYLRVSNAKLFPIEEKYPLLGNESAPGSPWPFPQQMSGSSNRLVYLNKDTFKIETNMKVDCDIISINIERYYNILFPPKITIVKPQTEKLDKLSVVISENGACPGYPTTEIDESYELDINGNTANIKTNSVWGALRGIETFSQLTFITNDNKLALNDSTKIKDFPRFKHRGLMLDTARHYIPVPIIKKQLDAMSYNKFNIMHWHIVDDQSFPMDTPKTHTISQNAAYTPAHIYTLNDIKDIQEHARLRGIRVVPEFDSPGHVAALGKTHPDLITVCWKDGKPYQAIYSIQAKAEIFNPTVEELYPLVKEVLTAFKEAFVDEYIHLGNDEVYYECWKSNPNISQWMKQKNFTQYNQLEAYYSEKLLGIAKDLNKKVVVWQDVYDNGVKLDKTTQIQVWKDTSTLDYHDTWQNYLSNITANGYGAILSSPWYLNFISYGYQDWYRYYNVEPFANFTGTEEQKKLVIGGEACLWAEYVDGTNIESRLWPRASAVAERLWSPATVNNVEDAKFRLDEHRCRMLRRGITAQPVLNGFCGDYEYGMTKSVVFEPEFNYFNTANNTSIATTPITEITTKNSNSNPLLKSNIFVLLSLILLILISQ